MMQKKALDVTTKGWSKNDLHQIKQKINDQNYRWKAHVLTKEGKKKFCYFYSKVDLEIMARQVEFTILKIVKL